MVRCHELIEEIAELDLTPGATGLHILEHLLQVAHPGRERLHLAETLVHRLQLTLHLGEGLPEALLQGGGQLLVHRLAHLLEFLAVVFLDGLEPFLDRLTHPLHPGIVLLDELVQSIRESGEVLLV